jgi:uncharacterized protein (TIGR00251 family)
MDAPHSVHRRSVIDPPPIRSGGKYIRCSETLVIHASGDGIIVDVRVIPRAGKSDIAGTRDGALLVRLNAAPVEGAANAELIEVLATALGLPRRAITLVSGGRSRQKRVRIAGVTVEQVREKLL